MLRHFIKLLMTLVMFVVVLVVMMLIDPPKSGRTKFDDSARDEVLRLMGAPLPASAQDVKFTLMRTIRSIDSQTAIFSLPPAEHADFMTRARPTVEAACWILPLMVEGTQAKQPDCGQKTMTVSIDKTNPALWRITIDVR